MDDAIGKLGSFKGAVAGVGVALGALATGALMKATSAAADFEEQMVEVEKVTDPETAAAMGDAIKEMASEMPVAHQELAEISAAAGRLGVEGEDNIREFTRVTSEMAIATDLAAGDAADSFARMSTLMNEPVSNVRSMGDAVNELSNTMATSSSEIVDAATRSSGVLTQLGLSSEQVLGLNAAMNEVSSSARIAGTQLRRFGQEIQDPKKVKDLADALGMSVSEFKAMRKNNPNKLIKTMARRFGEGGEEADKLRSTLSTTSRQTLAGLSQNLDSLNTAQATANEQFAEGGSLTEEYEAASSTFNSQVKVMKNRLRNLAIEIGEVLLPHAASMLEHVNAAIARFSEWNSKTDGVLGAVTLVTTAIGGFTAAGAAAVSMMGGMSAVLGTVTAGFAALLSPITLVVAAIGGLVALFASDFAGIRTVAENVLGAVHTEMSKTAAVVTDVLGPSISTTGSILRSFAASVSAWLEPVLDIFGLALVAAIQKFGEATRTTLKFVAARISEFVAVVRPPLQRFRAAWSEVFKWVGSFVRGVFGTLYHWLEGNTSLMESLMEQTARSFKNIWTTALDHLPASVRNAIGTIVDHLRTAKTTIRTILEPLERHFAIIWDRVNDLIPPMRDLGVKLGFINEQGAPTVRTLGKIGIALAGLTNPITTAVGLFLTLRKAFDKNIYGIRDTTNQVFPRVRAVMTTQMRRARAGLQRILERLRAVWDARIQPLVDSTRETFNTIRGHVTSVMTWIYDNVISRVLNEIMILWRAHGASLMQEVRETWAVIRSLIESALTAIMGVLRPALDLMWTVIKRTLDLIRKAWDRWGDEIMTIVSFTTDIIIGTLGTFADTIITSIKVLLNVIQGDWDEAWGEIRGLLERTLSGIFTFAKKWGRRFISWLSGVLDDLWIKFIDWRSNVTSTVTNLLGSLRSKAESWVSTFTKPFRDAADSVEAKFNGLKRTLVGNSIVPDMLGEMVGEAENFQSPFIKPFQDVKRSAISEFRQLKSELETKLKNRSRGGGGGGSGRFSSVGEAKKFIRKKAGSSLDYGKAFRAGLKHVMKVRKLAARIRRSVPKNSMHKDPLMSASVGNVTDILMRARRGDTTAFNSARSGGSDLQRAVYNALNMQGVAKHLRQGMVGFAHGGIVTGPTNALIGEAGPEAVVPLDQLPSLLAQAASEARPPAGSGRGGGTTIHIERIEANSREEGREAARGLTDELRSRGFGN